MPMITKYLKGVCAHCGADKGLHHSETEQCPKDGREEYREGRKQEWDNTRFYDAGIEQIESASIDLLEALQAALSDLKYSLATQGAVLGLSADRIKQFMSENSLIIKCETAIKKAIHDNNV